MPADNPHITVVNDNPDFLQLMHTLLAEDSGYDVTTIDGDMPNQRLFSTFAPASGGGLRVLK